MSISSCAGLATTQDGAADCGALQLHLLQTACHFLNRTADLDEAAEESEERVRSVRAEAEALEREIEEHSQLAGLIDGLTGTGSEGAKARPIVRYRMRF